MNIKIDRADSIFSQFIRLRDKQCVNPKCRSQVEISETGKPVSHQNSHFWSRRNEGTRFDPLNCDTLCFRCHQRWGGDFREEYIDFKKKQLGDRGYKQLDVRAHSYCKRDRTLSLLYVKELLKTLK